MKHQFKTYLELIFVLLTAEQTNELLLMNHDLRPTNTKAILEENVSISRNLGHNRDYEWRHWNGSHRGGDKSNQIFP